MDNESKRLFFSFLARHGALTKYKLNRNIYLQKKFGKTDDAMTNKPYYLSRAFSWRETPENYDYWAHLNQVWHDVIKY